MLTPAESMSTSPPENVPARQTVSGLLLNEIERLECDKVFLVPGANISSFVRELQCRTTINMMIANHELAAGFMALGYARVTGKPGVVCSIGSPGIAYLAGAMMTAAADGVPLLCISGNIPSESWGKGFFQDGSAYGTNDAALVREIIGSSCICHDAGELAAILSVMHSRLQAKRPVHIQLPIDLQSVPCEVSTTRCQPALRKTAAHRGQPPVCQTPHKKTLLLIGHRALDSIDPAILRRAVSRHAFGVITDIKSRGIIDEEALNALGYIGFNSSGSALAALDSTSPMSAEQTFLTGLDDALRARYVDPAIPASQIEETAFNAWLYGLATDGHQMPDHAERNNQWLKDLRRLDGFSPKDRQPQGRLLYSHLLEVCQQLLPPNTVYCLDSGQIRRAGNMMLKAHDRQTIVQSDTLSPMGMGLCAAIGAKAALPERPVVALVGDGSMRMHGMELSTAHRYHLPIIFVLCDNESLASTPGDDALKQLPCVQWDMFAYAFGVRTFFSTDKRAFAEQLKIAVASSDPVLLWTRVPKLLEEEIEITVNRFDTSWLSKFQK